MSRPRNLSGCSVADCERPVYGHGWCKMHYQRWRRNGNPLTVASRGPKNPRRNRLEDIWKYVQVGAPSECWPWLGAKRRRGYGAFTVATREHVAHRVAFQVATGIDPGGLMVCHHCDNPPCCNPAHLFLGTGTDNVRDMLAKGRARPRCGSIHHAAKLTESDVREIRKRSAAGERLVVLAREFGVGAARLSVIVNHPEKAWGHVT